MYNSTLNKTYAVVLLAHMSDQLSPRLSSFCQAVEIPAAKRHQPDLGAARPGKHYLTVLYDALQSDVPCFIAVLVL